VQVIVLDQQGVEAGPFLAGDQPHFQLIEDLLFIDRGLPKPDLAFFHPPFPAGPAQDDSPKVGKRLAFDAFRTLKNQSWSALYRRRGSSLENSAWRFT
jgi:hypothetical protein